MIPHKLLVATDGSESALAAESFAANLANSLGQASVLVAVAVRPRDVPITRGLGLMPLTDEELEQAKAVLEEAAARVSGMVNGGVGVETLLIESRSPAQGIVDAALKDGDCSMIVIGSRGHGGFGSLVMGSVSTQVVHGAHCPVVVVKG